MKGALLLFVVAAALVEGAAAVDCPSGYKEHGDKCYMCSDHGKDWWGAQRACQSDGGYLASIPDEDTQNFIKDHVKRDGWTVWIGGQDFDHENRFAWTDGSEIDYKKWNPGEPNNWDGDENCMMMNVDGHWNDGKCSGELGYICMVEPVECAPGYTAFGSRCYKWSSGKKSFWDAEADCKSENGGHVASMQNEATYNFLKNSKPEGTFWIGLTDESHEGQFKFTNGDAYTFSNWNSGEPNNWGGDEDCTQIVDNNKWNDISCGAEFVYPCEYNPIEMCPAGWDRFDESCYLYKMDKVDMETAEASCVTLGSHLVSITSNAEQEYVAGFGRSDADIWIGLTDKDTEGKFVWTDGSLVSETWWSDGEPNNWGGGEDCVEMWSNNKWNDVGCDDKNYYVCKMPANWSPPPMPPPSPPPPYTWVDYPDVVCKDTHIEGGGDNPNHDGKFERTTLDSDACTLDGCKAYGASSVGPDKLYAVEFKANKCQCDTFTDAVNEFKYKGKPGRFTCAVNTVLAGTESLSEYGKTSASGANKVGSSFTNMVVVAAVGAVAAIAVIGMIALKKRREVAVPTTYKVTVDMVEDC